jgi:hypothetical protein
MYDLDAPLLNTALQPLAEPERVDLRCGSVSADDLHGPLFRPAQPLRASYIFFPGTVVMSELRARRAVLEPVLAATRDGRLGVLRERDASGL